MRHTRKNTTLLASLGPSSAEPRRPVKPSRRLVASVVAAVVLLGSAHALAIPRRGTPAPGGVASAEQRLTTQIVAGIHRGGPNELDVERRAFEMMIDQGDVVFGSLRLTPNAGPVAGVRMFGVRPGSVMAALGFQNGDVLQSINGTAVATPEQARDVYVQQRESTTVVLVFVRRGAGSRTTLHVR